MTTRIASLHESRQLKSRPIENARFHVDPAWRTLYKIGGIALLIEGIAYLMITVMGAMIGVAPGNSLNWLNAIGKNPQLAILSYGVVTGIADFVLIPAALALYFALRSVSKTWILIATGIIFVYVAIDISTFVSTSIDLTWLTQQYSSATDPTQKAAILGAEYSLLSTVPLSQFLGWTFPTFAYLIIALAIHIGKFGRGIPFLGYLTVALSFAGGVSFLDPVPYLQNFQMPALALFGLFMLAMGIMLLSRFRGLGIRGETATSMSSEQEIASKNEQ